jgi:hypothetical protein
VKLVAEKVSNLEKTIRDLQSKTNRAPDKDNKDVAKKVSNLEKTI